MTTLLNKRGDRTGRPKLDRPYCYAAKSVWKANVRRAGDKKTYVGSYPTQEAALAAANHFLATGRKPEPGMFGGATRRGPKRKQAHEHRNPAKAKDATAPTSKASKAHRIAAKRAPGEKTRAQGMVAVTQDTKPERPNRSHQDTIALLRGIVARIG